MSREDNAYDSDSSVGNDQQNDERSTLLPQHAIVDVADNGQHQSPLSQEPVDALSIVTKAIYDLIKKYPQWLERKIHLTPSRWSQLHPENILHLARLNLSSAAHNEDGLPVVDVAGADYAQLRKIFCTDNPVFLCNDFCSADLFLGGTCIVVWHLLFLSLFFFAPRSLEFCYASSWSGSSSGLESCSSDEQYGCDHFAFSDDCMQWQAGYCPPGSFAHSAWAAPPAEWAAPVSGANVSCSFTNQVGFLVALGLSFPLLMWWVARVLLCATGCDGVLPTPVTKNWQIIKTFFAEAAPAQQAGSASPTQRIGPQTLFAQPRTSPASPAAGANPPAPQP